MMMNQIRPEPAVLDEPPLEEVVCQLRFDPILEITAASPTAFQNAVRARFPRLGEAHRLAVVVAGGTSTDRADDTTWQFGAADHGMTLGLSASFLSLTVARYTGFADLLDALRPALDALAAGFGPPRFTRCGLRYVNRLVMQREDHRPITWATWLHPALANVRLDLTSEASVLETSHLARLATEHGELVWRYGCDVGHTRGVPSERLTLDFDHHTTQPVAPDAVEPTLRALHRTINDLFRASFTDAGYAMFKPR